MNLNRKINSGVVAITFVVVQVASVFASEPVTYNQDILPILSENCFSCHGFDKGAREAGLRLDSLEGATQVLESGEVAIQAGNIQDSALISRILSNDPDVVMPPASSGKSLTTEQKETLQLWIAQGAKYEAHWAFIPPKQTEPPQVGTALHPIDRFVQARLKKKSYNHLLRHRARP